MVAPLCRGVARGCSNTPVARAGIDSTTLTDPAAPPPLPIEYVSPPQRPPRRAATLAAWLVILAAAAYIITTTAIEKSRTPAGGPTREFEFRIAARYAVGVARLFSALDTPGAE